MELGGAIPGDLEKPMGSKVFGCDICQGVCPWNRRAPATPKKEFRPRTFPAAIRTPLLEDTPGENIESLIQPETAESQEESFSLPRLEGLAGMDETEFGRICRAGAVKGRNWRGSSAIA